MRRRSESATMQRMTHVIEHEDKENQQPNRQDANPLKRRQSMGIMKLDMTSTILSPASKRRRKSVSFGVVDMRVYEKHGAISGDNTMDLGTVARFLDNGHITPVQEHDDDEISIASEVKSIDENKPNAMVETKDTTEDVFWSPVKEKDVETKEQVVIKEQALVTETLVEKETPKKEAEAQVEQKKENDVQPLQFNSMLNSWDHPDSNTEITMPSPASSSSSSSISTPSKKQDTSSFMFSPVAPTSSHLTSLHSDLDMSMTRMITAPIHINRTLHDMGLFSPEQELSLSPSTSHDDDDDMMMTRSHSSVIQLRDESTSTPASTQATPKSILKKTPTSSKSSTPKPVHMVDMEMTKMLEHPIHTLSQTLDHDNTSSVNGQGNDNTSSVNAPNNDHTSNVALDDDDDDVITFKSDGDDTPDDDMEMTRAHGTITSHTPQEMNESMILTKVHDGLIQTTSTSTHDGLIQTISTHDDINTSNLTMELTGIIPTHVQTQVTSSQADVTSSQPDVTSQPDVASQSDVDTQQPDLSEKEMEMTHVHTRITRSTPQKSTPRVTRSTPTKHTTSASPALRRSSRISSTPTSTQTTPRRSSRLSVSSTISTPAQHQVQASPVSSRKRTPRTSTPSRRRSSMMEITESYGRILSYRDDISHDVSHGGAAHDVSRDGDIHENEITLDDANDSLMDVSQIRQRPPSLSSIDMEMTRDLGRILSHHTPRRSSRLSISTPTGPTSQLAMHMHRILKGDVMDRTCDLPSHDKLSENTALVAGMYAQILEGVDVDVDVIKKQVQQEKDELATEEEDVEEDVKPATSAVPASPAPLATPLATLDLLDESMDLTGSLPPITPVASASPAPSVTSITVSPAPVPTSRRSSVMSRRTSRASLAAIDEENVDIDEPISSEPESTTSTFQSFIHRVGLAEFDDDSMEHTQMKMRRRDSSYTGVSEEPSIWPPSTSHGLIEAATMIIPEIDELQQGCVEVIDEGADVKSKIKELENQIEISPPEIVKMVRDANPQQLTILQTHISQLLHRCKLDAKVSWCGWRGKLTSRTLTRLQSHLESLHGDIQKIQEMNMELASVKNVWNNVHDPKLIEMRKQIQDTCDRIMTSESTLSTWLQRESDVASHISSLQSQHTLLSQQLHDLHQNTLTTKQQQEQLQIQQDTYAILSSICGWKPTRSTSTSIRLVYMDMFELMIEKERDRIMKGIPVLQIIKKYENEQWISSLLSTARPIIDSNLSTCTSFQQLSTCLSHLSLHLGRIHDLIIECMRLSKTYHISYDDEHHAIITLTSEKTQSQVVLYIPLHASYPHTSLFPNKSSVLVIASHHDRLNVRTVRQMGMAQHGYGKLTRICHAIEKMLE